MKIQWTPWLHWENAMCYANQLALETGIRHRVRSDYDGVYPWIVSPVE